jgi:hypothetical protein
MITRGTTVPSAGNTISDDAEAAALAADPAVEPAGPDAPSTVVGLVDGSQAASTRTFHVVLDDTAVVSLDELVVTAQTLPDGATFTHYGIVTEGYG